MLSSHEDEYVGYGEPYMVPTQRRSSSFQTPETSRHNSLSSPGSGDGPCSSQRSNDSHLLFSRIYDECAGSSDDSVDVHCLLHRVKTSLPHVSGGFMDELSFALDSSCRDQCVTKAQFIDAVGFSLPEANQKRYDPPKECTMHEQNILQLQHTVRILRQEREESHQQIQQLEGQYMSLTTQVQRLSSTNSSLSLEAERCRELSAECGSLQAALCAEQQSRAEAVSSLRELQTRLERQDGEIAQLTCSLDRAEGELRDRDDLQRQLETAAQLACCQVGELSAALVKWRSRDEHVRNTVDQLKQALKDAEDSVLRAVEEKRHCEQELVVLRSQSLTSAGSPPFRHSNCQVTQAQPKRGVVNSGGRSVSSEVVCSIRDEIFQSIECDSCSEEIYHTLPLSGISSSVLIHEGSLDSPAKSLQPTSAIPASVDAPDACAGGVLGWRWRDVVCVSSSDDCRVSGTDEVSSAEVSLTGDSDAPCDQARASLGDIVDHLLLLDVSSAASFVVSDDPVEVGSGDVSALVEEESGDVSASLEERSGDASASVEGSGDVSVPVEEESGDVSASLEEESGDASASVKGSGDVSVLVEEGSGDVSASLEEESGDVSAPVEEGSAPGSAGDLIVFSSSDGDCSGCSDEYPACSQPLMLGSAGELCVASSSSPRLLPDEGAVTATLSHQMQCVLIAGVVRALALLSAVSISLSGSRRRCQLMNACVSATLLLCSSQQTAVILLGTQ